jgi:hypothetical protein
LLRLFIATKWLCVAALAVGKLKIIEARAAPKPRIKGMDIKIGCSETKNKGIANPEKRTDDD